MKTGNENGGGPGQGPTAEMIAAFRLQDRQQRTDRLAPVVDLEAARLRRADDLGLDHLDATGWCCCWTLPRPCPLAAGRTA